MSLVAGLSRRDPTRRVRVVLLVFCALAAASLVVIYLLAPALFVETLFAKVEPATVRSAPLTLFLALVLALIGLIAYGVTRRWRWIWWGLQFAFAASALEVPVIALELAGVLPLTVPPWYAALRLLVAAALAGIALWMWRIYRTGGIWGMRGPAA